MFKLMFIVAFMFIGTSVFAARLSCDSCGNECAAACGTRRFRSCCFNYLRKKRGPYTAQFLSSNNLDANLENSLKPLTSYFIAENVPEEMIPNHITEEYKPFYIEEKVNNQAHV